MDFIITKMSRQNHTVFFQKIGITQLFVKYLFHIIVTLLHNHFEKSFFNIDQMYISYIHELKLSVTISLTV